MSMGGRKELPIKSNSTAQTNIPPANNGSSKNDSLTSKFFKHEGIVITLYIYLGTNYKSNEDESPNNNNDLTTHASTTNNLTATVSESGPLMKVVVSPERGPVELLESTDGATIIYTDASVLKDGTTGIGVYFGKDHQLNTSERLSSRHSSSGWAEIIAATCALMKLRDWDGYK